jgi:hypothetical protein
MNWSSSGNRHRSLRFRFVLGLDSFGNVTHDN